MILFLSDRQGFCSSNCQDMKAIRTDFSMDAGISGVELHRGLDELKCRSVLYFKPFFYACDIPESGTQSAPILPKVLSTQNNPFFVNNSIATDPTKQCILGESKKELLHCTYTRGKPPRRKHLVPAAKQNSTEKKSCTLNF
ncbi:hypothetical protein JTE90_004658 [Oedothorax gibbosus]|uniref:Uncharacterized protein n=1 Tax=Oedothorax gibbosus TaxID=931172 RepID=A0AAV6UYY4_9ARAC|nr:hypothetical protein JTE90_004658 [Oedothorax gibbosus]